MNAKPSTFFDDLKARLNNLEIEQRKQSSALNQLGDLEAEVMRLEARLKHIDGDMYHHDQAVNFNNMRDLDEITRLEHELRHMDDKELKDFNEKRYFDEINQLRSELGIVTQNLGQPITTKHHTPTPPKTAPAPAEKPAAPANAAKRSPILDQATSTAAQVTPKKGYVVCLMFNPRSPTEWSEASGGGWRERGQGQCYPTVDHARAALTKLKQQWPRHPLKIVKRG